MKRARSRWIWLASLGLTSVALAALVVPAQLSTDEVTTVLRGETAGAQVGSALTYVRDLNGDTYPDLVVGAPLYPTDTKMGRIYVFFGKTGQGNSAWERTISLSEADVVLTGDKNNENVGASIINAGDLNADGIIDLAVGAPGNNEGGTNGGKVFIVFGRKTGWSKSDTLSNFSGASFIGYTSEKVGISLARGGQLNGTLTDFAEDLIIGSESHTEAGKLLAGRAFIVFGRKTGWEKNVKLTDTTGKTSTTAVGIASIVGDVADQRVGRVVGGMLNLNQDGYDDFILGAPGDTAAGQNDRGQVGIVFGKASGWGRDSSFAATLNMLVTGEQDGSGFGKTVTTSASLDGDVAKDIIVAAPDFDGDGGLVDTGKIYIFRAKGSTTFSTGNNFTADKADASWLGEAIYDRAGSSLADVGDFNLDGVEDLLVGAELADVKNSSDNAGRVYLVGGQIYVTGTKYLKDALIKVMGSADNGRAGQGMAGRFDLDGDYFTDIAIGVPNADPSSLTNAGAIYILRGAEFADQDTDGYTPFQGDCDDQDASLNPAAKEVAYDGVDQDCSGSDLKDVDKDGYNATVVGGNDCNDNVASINPGAAEVCNGADENCNGSIDEGVQSTYYLDKDGDGYGSPSSSTTVKACSQPSGYSKNFSDCQDDPAAGGASIYPGATEIAYDGIDQDCSGGDLIDADGDGEAATVAGGKDCDDGNPDYNSQADDIPYNGLDEDCDGSDLADLDNDGYIWVGVPGGTDCNDDNGGVHPNATELPYNGLDEDCSGSDLVDVDGDGYVSTVVLGDDCNDNNASVYPGAEDLPNDGIDQNCDDVQATDYDGDGVTWPDGGDCNDEEESIYPNAPESPYDGIDQDCDGTDVTDVDGDGFEGIPAGGSDCDDRDSSVFPGAYDPPYDGIDQDCDGVQVNDVDGDGYNGIPAGGDDCNDQDPEISPGQAELPGNLTDENCNGVASDQDGDGYGSSPDLFGRPEDCNDADVNVRPGAVEVPYDGIDQDCSGFDLTDVDGDGFEGERVNGSDCDDEDPLINPAAEELKGNGIDDNCDELIDEEDVDEDGYSAEAGDCNDDDPAVNPGASEQVGDNADNDCNGRIDERIISGDAVVAGCSCRVDGAKNSSEGAYVWMLVGLLALKWRRVRAAREK